MPSIASHLVVAKLVSKHLNINSDDFYKGNILPDIIDKDNSHLKIKGTYYEIPNTKYCYDILNLDNDLDLGYLCHLLLDKYFLEEYVLNNVKNYKECDPFLTKKMYNDYTKINYKLINSFDLDIVYINRVMNNINNDENILINHDKYNFNLESINTKIKIEKLECIELDSYIRFLKEISIVIAKDLEKRGNV